MKEHSYSLTDLKPFECFFHIYDMAGKYLDGFVIRMKRGLPYRLFIVDDAYFIFVWNKSYDVSWAYEISYGEIQDYYIVQRSMFDGLLSYDEKIEGYHLNASFQGVFLVNEALGEKSVIWAR